MADIAAPPWAFLMNQANQVPPDSVQLAQQNPAPPYLTPNPGANGATPNLGPVPEKSPYDVSESMNPLSQTPAVSPYGLTGYLRPNRELEKASLDRYNVAAQQALAAQGGGLDTIQQYIQDLQGKPQGINWTPLAAYIDSQNPNSHMVEAAKAMAPMSPDEKNKLLLDLQLKLQGARGTMSKDQLDAMANQMKMQHDNYRDDAMIQHYMNEDKTAATRAGGVDSRERMAAERQYLNDPVNKQYVPRLDGAIKIMNLMDAADRGEFKSNKALLGQLNQEIARLETGSQSPALGSQEKTEMHDAAASLRDYYDTLNGGVTGVDLGAKFQQARGMVGDLARSYREQIDSRNEVLKAGATPVQQAIFDAKAKTYGRSVDARVGKTSGGGKPQTVTQGGHTYTLNPKTGEYE